MNFQKNKFQFLLIIIAVFAFGGCNIKQLAYFSPGQTVNKTTGQPASAAPQTSVPGETAPLPGAQDTIRLFFNLIDEHKPEEAVAMLSVHAAPDKETYNFWLDNFDSLTKAKVISLEPWRKDEWSATREIYQATLEMMTKTGQLQYGWEPGGNTRWLEAVKSPESGLWQINQIATGP